MEGSRNRARVLRTSDVDLGPIAAVELHHLVGEGDLVAQHLTHGPTGASTMPLLADTTSPAAGVTFIHIRRSVADGMIVEHWACRDDMALLEPLRD